MHHSRSAAASTLAVCPRVLRHGLEQIVRAVPAAGGHTCGAGCLHPVLDGGQESLEAKVRESQDTLVQPDGTALETRFICKGKEAIVSTHNRFPLICTTYMHSPR